MRGSVDLSDAETRHTERVCALIRDEIAAAGGWISFERYMDLALYAPGLGYYSAGARKLGSGGDFTTAPEISGLFGACLAQQCAEVLSAVAGGSILEVGAGSGRLAVDIMTRLEALERLPDRYYILEVSADLSARQRALVHAHIPHLEPRMQWLEAPPLKPFDGVILANEVLDALPVVRFRWCAGACEEFGVAVGMEDVVVDGAAFDEDVGVSGNELVEVVDGVVVGEHVVVLALDCEGAAVDDDLLGRDTDDAEVAGFSGE